MATAWELPVGPPILSGKAAEFAISVGSQADLVATGPIVATGKFTIIGHRHRLHTRELDMADKSRILIADDNQPNRELLEAYLTDIDCEVENAVDGLDTLTKAKSYQPDLILLDVMMPKLSGFEVCKKLKDDPTTSRIMILMVTALNELGDIERAVNAGTNDFLSKPVNKLELVKRVENMLKLKDVSDENERLRRYIETMEEGQRPSN